MVTVKIKGGACCLYNVYTVVTISHGITSGSYTTYWVEQLYLGRVQGVSVHSTSHLYCSLIVVYLNCTREAGI